MSHKTIAQRIARRVARRSPTKLLFARPVYTKLRRAFGKRFLPFFDLYAQLQDVYEGVEDRPEDGFAPEFRDYAKLLQRRITSDDYKEQFKELVPQMYQNLRRFDRLDKISKVLIKRIIDLYTQMIDLVAADKDLYFVKKRLKQPGFFRYIKEGKPPKEAAVEPIFSEEERNLPELPSQDTTDPDELFREVSETHEKQLDWLNRGNGIDAAIDGNVFEIEDAINEGLAMGLKGDDLGDYISNRIKEETSRDEPLILIGPPKKRDRAQEKVDEKFDGDWSKMTDLVRSSIAVDTYEDMKNLVKKLKASGLKLGSAPLNRFLNPTEAGYRDIKLDVEFENGHVGELQLHVKPIMKVKESAHKLYETVRSIKAEAKEEGREDLTAEEQREVDEANAKMKAIYDQAWQEASNPSQRKESHVMKRKAMATKYFNFDGIPAYWEHRKFPKIINETGREKFYYDLEDFFHDAVPISKREFDEMLEKRSDKRSSVSGTKLRNELVKLAYKKPELRAHLLPLLKKG